MPASPRQYAHGQSQRSVTASYVVTWLVGPGQGHPAGRAVGVDRDGRGPALVLHAPIVAPSDPDHHRTRGQDLPRMAPPGSAGMLGAA